jgi:enoyl-CoA hydratase/carnithine racemase
MTDDTILTRLEGHVALVELNSGPHNFFSEALLGNLTAKLQELDGNPDCRAVVLAARGKSFCSGADFGAGIKPSQIPAVAKRLYQSAQALFELKKPLVAAIQGPAIGGGLGLALTADFRVACAEAKLAANFAQLGMHCGFAISASLPHTIGMQAAARLLLTGCRINGQEAKEMGLVDVLVGKDEVLERALAFAQELASAAPLAVQSMKATLRANLLQVVPATLARELAQQEAQVLSADFVEGIQASLQRRAPAFVGR